MKSFPKIESSGKTGVRVPSKSERRPAPSAAKFSPALRAEAAEYRRELHRLIGKRQREVVVQLATEAHTEWQLACRGVAGDTARREALKKEYHVKLTRALRRAVPRFREAEALRRAHLRRYARIAADGLTPTFGRPAQLDWQTIVPPPADNEVDYLPPWPAQEFFVSDPNGLLKVDDSVILPEPGHLIQNFTFEHDESNWGVQSHQNWVRHGALCGMDYTMPRSGRVQVAAKLDNFYNRAQMDITDNFGFSSSTLSVEMRAVIILLYPDGEREFFLTEPFLRSSLSSGGDDISRSFSDLDTSVTYGVGALSLHNHDPGTVVTIRAGAFLVVDSDTDDMKAHARLTYWWRLRRLTVGVFF